MPAYSILLYFCTPWPKKRDVRNSWLSLDSSTRKIKKGLLMGSGWTGSGSWMTVGTGGKVWRSAAKVLSQMWWPVCPMLQLRTLGEESGWAPGEYYMEGDEQRHVSGINLQRPSFLSFNCLDTGSLHSLPCPLTWSPRSVSPAPLPSSPSQWTPGVDPTTQVPISQGINSVK